MNKDKVSKCCGAELYDQAENNYGGGYAPNEVCSHCEKRAERVPKKENIMNEDILKDILDIIRLMDIDINSDNDFLYRGGLSYKMRKQFGEGLSKERRAEELRIYAIINAQMCATRKWRDKFQSLVSKKLGITTIEQAKDNIRYSYNDNKTVKEVRDDNQEDK